MRLFCILTLLPCLHFAQSTLGYFRASQTGNHILLEWSTLSGFECQDLKLQRGPDSTSFSTIYTYPGICGNDSNLVSYSYTDVTPYPNALNYYRIDMGTYGYSDTIFIRHVSYDNNGLAVFPVPAVKEVQIFFTSALGNSSLLKVFDRRGNKKIEKQISGNSAVIQVWETGKGAFLFTITNIETGDQKSGKFIFE